MCLKTERMSEPSGGADGEEASTEREPRSEGRRHHPRYSVEAEITLASEDNFYAGLVENLSVSGIFISTFQLRRIGERIDFSIRLGDSDDLVRGVGEVRWLRQYSETSDTPPGMGLSFIELDANSRARIELFLGDREPLLFDDE
jgi:uncharacterized protein (TIGR02266 family)